jgi:hypothetical protein
MLCHTVFDSSVLRFHLYTLPSYLEYVVTELENWQTNFALV